MKKSLVVVTPVYRAPESVDEHFSLRQLRRHLGAYHRVVVAPQGMQLRGFDDFQVVRFPARFFESVYGYNKLLLTRRFYRCFAKFEWMLIYQLDALVFRDELSRWCEMPYDYIGAPIVVPVHWAGAVHGLNGGFSLRRIAAFERVLHGGDAGQRKAAADGMVFMQRRLPLRLTKNVLLWLHLRGSANVVPLLILRSGYPEDLFWSNFAPLLDREFRVAPKEVAKEFALETEPARLFQELGNKLPFGCHAWQKHDPAFWAKILREYKILA